MAELGVRPQRWRRSVTLSLGILFVLGIGVLMSIPPLIMGPVINMHVEHSQVYSPHDFGLVTEDLSFTTEDGITLSAFRVLVEDPKAVILYLSGIHNPSVTAFYGHARMLAEHGYASILLDMRAHGQSQGELIGLGHLEVRDVQAVVSSIESHHDLSGLPIILHGLSMGGTTAINATGQIPQIAGVISMSAYSSWEDVFAENMEASGFPRFLSVLQKPFVKLYSLYKYGYQTRDLYPKRQIQNLGDRPALIMHSTEDSQVGYGNFLRIMEKAPTHVESWTRPGDLHLFVTDFLEPENDPEYSQQVLGFLERHFGR